MVFGLLDQLQISSVLFDTIAWVFNRSGATRGVALDISKTFDRVWQVGLLHKRKSYVRPNSPQKWSKLYIFFKSFCQTLRHWIGLKTELRTANTELRTALKLALMKEVNGLQTSKIKSKTIHNRGISHHEIKWNYSILCSEVTVTLN